MSNLNKSILSEYSEYSSKGIINGFQIRTYFLTCVFVVKFFLTKHYERYFVYFRPMKSYVNIDKIIQVLLMLLIRCRKIEKQL